MGAHLEYDGLKKVLTQIDPKWGAKRKIQKQTPKQVNREWNRLAAFMSGRT